MGSRCHTERMAHRGKGGASLRRQELGSWDNVSFGGKAGPGLEGSHVYVMGGFFALF